MQQLSRYIAFRAIHCIPFSRRAASLRPRWQATLWATPSPELRRPIGLEIVYAFEVRVLSGGHGRGVRVSGFIFPLTQRAGCSEVCVPKGCAIADKAGATAMNRVNASFALPRNVCRITTCTKWPGCKCQAGFEVRSYLPGVGGLPKADPAWPSAPCSTAAEVSSG